MTKLKLITGVLLIVFICSNLLAQEKGYVKVKDAKQTEEKLLAASAKTKSIACDFTQVKRLEYLSTDIESSGKFLFADGTKLRWEYTQPFNYIIAINNGVFSIKDEGKTTVFDTKSNKAFKELNDILMSTVDGTLMSSGQFSFSISEDAKSYLVELTPLSDDMKTILSKINLYFTKTDLAVFKVKMVETANDYTVINFTDRKLNTEIDASLFQLK